MFQIILLILLFLAAGSGIHAWEGKVFKVNGEKIVVYSSATSKLNFNTEIYFLQNGRVVGTGKVTRIQHSSIHAALVSGGAEKGLLATDIAPKSFLSPGSGDPFAGIRSIDRILLEAASKGDLLETQKALASGAKLTTRDYYLNTPLSNAAVNGHLPVVNFLIKHKADLGVRNRRGETALMLAARFGHAEVVKVLLNHGADVNLIDFSGWNALKFAEQGRHSKVIAQLKEAGAR